MLFQNLQIQKLFSGLIILSMLAPAVLFSFLPKKASAQWVVTDPAQVVQTGLSIKDVAKEILRQFLILAAKRVLARITQNTINWINSGFHGNPLYIENPKSFFNDIKKTEIKYLANLFGFDRNRYPYGRSFAQNIINAYQAQLATNAEYTLSRIINDPVLLEAYRTDFNAGGWNGFLVNTQYPQNNYIGFNMMATEELARRLDGTHQTAAKKVETTLSQGMGFLSPQACPSNPRYNNFKNEFQRPSFQPTTPYSPPAREQFSSDDAWGLAMLNYEKQYQEFVAAEKGVWEQTNTCPGGLVATTPGSVVGSHIQTALNSKFRQNELAAALGNDLTSSIAAILDALMNKFLTDGLNKLSNFVNPAEEGRCDFEYFGDRLEECGGVNTTFGTDGGGQCAHFIAETGADLRGEVVSAIERALDENSALADSPADRENIQGFRDLVVGQLQSAGFEASASYNGNCNLSPNNLGVRAVGTPFGEIYDVVRDNPAQTIRDASTNPQFSRPIYAGDANWGFITEGSSGAGTDQPDPNTLDLQN